MKTKWNADTFLTAVSQRSGKDAARVARQLLDWCDQKGLPVRWGTGAKTGYFAPLQEQNGKKPTLFRCWTIGTVDFPAEMKERIENIPGVKVISAKASEQPSIHLADLAEQNAIAQFLRIWDEVVNG